jgi:hypothetical protein
MSAATSRSRRSWYRQGRMGIAQSRNLRAVHRLIWSFQNCSSFLLVQLHMCRNLTKSIKLRQYQKGSSRKWERFRRLLRSRALDHSRDSSRQQSWGSCREQSDHCKWWVRMCRQCSSRLLIHSRSTLGGKCTRRSGGWRTGCQRRGLSLRKECRGSSLRPRLYRMGTRRRRLLIG